jgi:hypothetical protein
MYTFAFRRKSTQIAVEPSTEATPAMTPASQWRMLGRMTMRRNVASVVKEADAQRAREAAQFEDTEEAATEEKIREPPSSWHHAARLRVLARKTSPASRVLWFSSSIGLVLVQMCVMLSFLSALSAVRCTHHDDCGHGSYCSGLTTMKSARDPLAMDKRIQRGICMGCSKRPPNEEHVDGLLEVLCPGEFSFVGEFGPASNSSAGLMCVGSCMASCISGVHSMSSASAVTQASLRSSFGKHISRFTADETACAATCSLGRGECDSTLSDGMSDKFDKLVGDSSWRTDSSSSNGLRAYKAWINVHDQCEACVASVRENVRYATPEEAENLRILKMSFLDFVALGLAAMIVSLIVMREIRDLNVGQMMTLQTVRRDADLAARKGDVPVDDEFELVSTAQFWRSMLGLQAFLRRYLILTDVSMVVVLMVARFGGDTVSIMLNTLAALFMLELDNLAFDYGLTAGTKAEIEDEFKVELGASQLELLNWSRRWHVISLSIFLLVITTTLPVFQTIWMRMRIMSTCLIFIIAVGELIELYLRAPLRSLKSNVQRFTFFLVKVALALVYKWQVVQVLSYLATSSAPLDF